MRTGGAWPGLLGLVCFGVAMLGSVSQGLDFMAGRVLVRSASVLRGKDRNINHGVVGCGNVWIGEVG